MAVGPKDHIDRALVNKYASEKTMTVDDSGLAIAADSMMKTMEDFASMHRTMVNIQSNLKNLCSKVVAQGARYCSSRT